MGTSSVDRLRGTGLLCADSGEADALFGDRGHGMADDEDGSCSVGYGDVYGNVCGGDSALEELVWVATEEWEG